VNFDPISLRMKSCLGWSKLDVHDMRAWIIDEVRAAGGRSGDYWWYFPRQH
jgi:hypothetical protein